MGTTMKRQRRLILKTFQGLLRLPSNDRQISMIRLAVLHEPQFHVRHCVDPPKGGDEAIPVSQKKQLKNSSPGL
jgi:hypothetical protein